MKWNEETIDKNKQVDNEGRRPTDPDYIHTKNTYHLIQRTHIVRETLLVKVYDDDQSGTMKELIENNSFVVLNEDKQQVLSHIREFQTEREWLLAQNGLVFVPPKEAAAAAEGEE